MIRKDKNGGRVRPLIELLCRPLISIDIIVFQMTPPYRDPIVLHQKYIVEQLSIRQIAEEFLSSREAVRVGLINAGIELREACKPHGRPSQIRYGKKIIKGKVVEYQAEIKVVTAVRQMRAQGLSLREIAENLSAIGVPTKCNGKKWHPEMVKRILQ